MSRSLGKVGNFEIETDDFITPNPHSELYGTVVLKGQYREGKMDGLVRKYHDDVLINTTEYNLGVKHGESLDYRILKKKQFLCGMSIFKDGEKIYSSYVGYGSYGANAEALKVNQAVKQVTEQTDFNFDFFPPVQNYITSGYGKKRFINGNPRSPHLALDIDGNEGDPIYAPKAGVVVIAEEHFYSGKMMLINHGGGLFTSYSHMSDWVAEEGDYVEAKELIGKVGSSGRVTGPHLHWVVYLNGNRINPELLVDLQYYQD